MHIPFLSHSCLLSLVSSKWTRMQYGTCWRYAVTTFFRFFVIILISSKPTNISTTANIKYQYFLKACVEDIRKGKRKQLFQWQFLNQRLKAIDPKTKIKNFKIFKIKKSHELPNLSKMPKKPLSCKGIHLDRTEVHYPMGKLFHGEE